MPATLTSISTGIINKRIEVEVMKMKGEITTIGTVLITEAGVELELELVGGASVEVHRLTLLIVLLMSEEGAHQQDSLIKETTPALDTFDQISQVNNLIILLKVENTDQPLEVLRFLAPALPMELGIFENLAVVTLAIATMQVAFPERLVALTTLALETMAVAMFENLAAVAVTLAMSIVMLESRVQLATVPLGKVAILGLSLGLGGSVANKDNNEAEMVVVDTVEGSELVVVEAINQQLLVLVKVMLMVS